ncbi:Uncharacterised protein [Mycobacteroides abscessus subsp. abscessus]|nr:Uncharacterised protein [Mycobacteroides abscessus subsp. abscessus]
MVLFQPCFPVPLGGKVDGGAIGGHVVTLWVCGDSNFLTVCPASTAKMAIFARRSASPGALRQ